MKKGLWRFSLGVLTLGLGIFLARSMFWSPFSEAEIRQYEDLLGSAAGADSRASLAHRTGKVVLIRPSSWLVYRRGNMFRTQIGPEIQHKMVEEVNPPRIDDAWYHLDSTFRATSPGEVSTVIFCDYRNLPVAAYMGTDNFYGNYASHKRVVCLKAYDFRTRAFLGECLLAEKTPEVEVPVSGPYTGQPEEIADFVDKLPVRR